MNANRDAVVLGQRDGLAHGGWVAGVEAARDVGRGDVLHHLLVEAHLPGAEALPHVAVQVDSHGASLQSFKHFSTLRPTGFAFSTLRPYKASLLSISAFRRADKPPGEA